MTENTPSDALAIWEAAYSAAMLAGIDDEAGAAVIADALAERDAEIARLRDAHDKAGHLLDTFRFESDADVFRLIDSARAALGSAKV